MSPIDSTTYIALVNTAFNDEVEKTEKVSYNSTIDVQFGIYRTGFYQGWLTVNLKPSHGGVDWKINVKCWPVKTPYGKAHAGYWGEFEKYKDDLLSRIEKHFADSKRTGILLVGRSKGAAEAEMLAPLIREKVTGVICLGAIEPPRCVDEEYKRAIEASCTSALVTCYKNDIVPGLPFWFEHPFDVWQNGKRTLGLSIKDHEVATTEKEVWL